MINKVILLGAVGADPEVKNFDSGKKVCSFSLATSEQHKDKNTGERKSETTWHNVVLWNSLADIAEKYVSRGSKLYVEGKIKTRSYEDGNGTKKYITEIVAENIRLLGEKPASAQSQVREQPNREAAATFTDDTQDDLPF